MCGIYFSKGVSLEKNISALNAQSHRGPDSTNYYSSDDVFIGHNRLSILDLNERSNQPMTIGHWKMAFNGEVYNFLVLKDDLLSKGVEFETTSDTEVLLKGFILEGEAFFSKVVGMFSFCLYNFSTQQLWVCRDYYGVKPLFYWLQKDKLILASEISPFCEVEEFNHSSDAIAYYLRYGFMPDGFSPYEDILEFPRNSYAIIDLSGMPEIIEQGPVFTKSNSWNQIESFSQIFNSACKLRTISDVPVGLFMSSGIDSTAISNEIASTNITAYTVSFGDSSDESQVASITAGKLDIKHKILSCHFDESKSFLSNIDNFLDVPFADPSYVPFLLMNSKAKEKIKVAITGDGGDELLYGYKRYKYIILGYFVTRIPWTIRLKIAGLRFFSSNHRLKELLATKDFDGFCSRLMAGVSEDYLKYKTGYGSKKIGDLKQYFLEEEKNYLKNDILFKADRGGMHFGIEVRSPFLDYRFKGLKGKSFLRICISAFFPKQLLRNYLRKNKLAHVLQRKKQGFTFNMSHELRLMKDEVDACVYRVCDHFPDLVHRERVIELLVGFHASENEDYRTIYKLFVLGKWLEKRQP